MRPLPDGRGSDAWRRDAHARCHWQLACQCLNVPHPAKPLADKPPVPPSRSATIRTHEKARQCRYTLERGSSIPRAPSRPRLATDGPGECVGGDKTRVRAMDASHLAKIFAQSMLLGALIGLQRERASAPSRAFARFRWSRPWGRSAGSWRISIHVDLAGGHDHDGLRRRSAARWLRWRVKGSFGTTSQMAVLVTSPWARCSSTVRRWSRSRWAS